MCAVSQHPNEPRDSKFYQTSDLVGKVACKTSKMVSTLWSGMAQHCSSDSKFISWWGNWALWQFPHQDPKPYPEISAKAQARNHSGNPQPPPASEQNQNHHPSQNRTNTTQIVNKMLPLAFITAVVPIFLRSTRTSRNPEQTWQVLAGVTIVSMCRQVIGNFHDW